MHRVLLPPLLLPSLGWRLPLVQADDPPPEPLPELRAAAPEPPPLFPGGLPLDPGELPRGLANLSAQGCNACHGAVHDAWDRSGHHLAQAGPAFRAVLRASAGNPLCTSCHLPLLQQQPRLLVSYGGGPLGTATTAPNPSWDATLYTEGVTCVACHVRDGTVLGPSAAPAAPHPVTATDELDSSEACAPCHQLTWPSADKPLYDTFGEWSRSAFATAGIRCQDCHMPPADGGLGARPDHAAAAIRARALSVLLDLPSPVLVRGRETSLGIRVQNTGAGHSVPTGSPFVAFVLAATLRADTGEPLLEPFTHTFERVVEGAPPWHTLSDTRLPAGGERLLDWTFTLPQQGPSGDVVLELTVSRRDSTGATLAPFLVQRVPLSVE